VLGVFGGCGLITNITNKKASGLANC